jgi:pimeloyl-ACP methyl ester carboxylesterase
VPEVGFGVDYGAFSNSNQHQQEELNLHNPDDLAAIPPVIRTSKPPSGHSSLTAPPAQHESGSLRGFLRPNSLNSLPSKSSKEQDEAVSSIGSPTIERRPSRDSIASLASTGSVKKKQGRGGKVLLYMSSKERLKENGNPRRRASAENTTLGLNGLGLTLDNKPNLPPISSEPFMSDTVIVEEEPAGPNGESSFLDVDSQSKDASSSPERLNHNSPAVSGGASPGLSSGRVIPTRDSSLHKTGSPGGKKRSSHRSSRRNTKELEVDGSTIKDEAGDVRVEKGKGKSKGSRKEPPASIFTNDQPLKTRSTLNSPIATSPLPQTSTTTSVQTSEAGTLSEFRVIDDDQCAPSPSIVQRKARDSGSKNGLTPKPARSSVDKENVETSFIGRSNSILKPNHPMSPPADRQQKHSSAKKTRDTTTPQHVLADDRPSSADSIDDAVDAYLCSPRLSQKIRHPQTGRVISFSEVGDSEGFAVFCCVGMGLTRYITAFYDELALTLKLRLITPDRPGVGDSESYTDGTGTPLAWPGKKITHVRAAVSTFLTFFFFADDVYVICQALKITKFSILAHSAGAIYALATALRMPQHIRGRIHLLAPWIPPSQMNVFGSQQDSLPTSSIPTSQRILRALPTPILKAANSSFMNATSTSITSSLPKSPRRTKRRSANGREFGRITPSPGDKRDSLFYPQPPGTDIAGLVATGRSADEANPNSEAAILAAAASTLADQERQTTYDARLTHAIWELATTNANPAVDLLICLERRQTIGFRYVDITRAVVIHHGTRDTRVPVENVKWLGKTMRRCEVRILEGEGHGLMASAAVMGGVLMEIAREWEDWTRLVQQRPGVTSNRPNAWGSDWDQ